jgi:hypothetical protein
MSHLQDILNAKRTAFTSPDAMLFIVIVTEYLETEMNHVSKHLTKLCSELSQDLFRWNKCRRVVIREITYSYLGAVSTGFIVILLRSLWRK